MIVIDASIAIKIINTKEEGNVEAINLFQSHMEGREEIIVPEFLFIEVANALATKSQTQNKEIKEGLNVLYEANLILYDLQKEDLIEASVLAKQYETSVYDMLYAVVAKNKKIKLITADARFTKKVGFSYVKHLSYSGVSQLAPK